jgi:hypothetical protein
MVLWVGQTRDTWKTLGRSLTRSDLRIRMEKEERNDLKKYIFSENYI